MRIRKFEEYVGVSEDRLLSQCGYADASKVIEMMSFYHVDDDKYFLFIEEEEINWIKGNDTFSVDVYEPIKNKQILVNKILGKQIAVFVHNNESYTYYGVYKLNNPYKEIGGAGLVVETYEPLYLSFTSDNWL